MEKKERKVNRALLDLLILVISLRLFLFIYDKEYLKYIVGNYYRKDVIKNNDKISQGVAAAANLYSQGKILEAQGKYDDALAAFKKSIELNPGFGNAHLMLGVVYTRKSQFKEAEREYRTALKLKMNEINKAITHCNLGVIYLENIGLYNKAIEEYEASIKIHPQPEPDFDPYHGLARAYLAKVDYDKAIENAKKDVEFHPDSTRGLFALGTAYLLKRDLDSAKDVSGKLEAIDRNSAAELNDKIERAEQERSEIEELSAIGCSGDNVNAACFYMRARYLAIFPPSDFYGNFIRKVIDVIGHGWVEDNEELKEIVIKNQAAIAEFKKAAKFEKCDYSFVKSIRKNTGFSISLYPLELAELVIAEGMLFEKENKADSALDNYLSVLKLAAQMEHQKYSGSMSALAGIALQNILYFPLEQYINRKDVSTQSYRSLLDGLVYLKNKKGTPESIFEEEKEIYVSQRREYEIMVRKEDKSNKVFYDDFYQEYDKLIDEYYGYLIAASKENKPEIYEEKVKQLKNEVEEETKAFNLTWQALKDKMKSSEKTGSPALSAKILFSQQIPPYNRMITTYYISFSKLNILITAAAVKLYKVNNGRMPDTLQELLPTYFSRLPDDPFNNFEPLKYKKSDKKGWVIYSFGPDKEDNEANLQYNENSSEKKGDIVLLLE